MSDDKEREDYDALTKAPGWLRFVNAQTKKWTDEFDRFVRAATADTNDTLALQKLRQIMVARDAILTALKFPEERLRQLDDASAARILQQQPALSRRGPL